MKRNPRLTEQLQSFSVEELEQLKTFWKGKRGPVWSFFCPNCRSARKLPYQPKPGGPRHFFQVGITAAFFTLLTWNWFTWKGIVSFVPIWVVFEFFYRARVRAAVACTNCGFDPFLYLDDVGRARKEIENHWRRKFAEKGIPFPEKGALIEGEQAIEAVGSLDDTMVSVDPDRFQPSPDA